MADELKPCPFCEQQAEVGRYGNPRLSTIIECTNCGCRMESSDQYPDYGRSWNDRPIEDALRAEVEELRLGVMTASERAGKYHAEAEALKKELDTAHKTIVKYIEEDNAGYLAATAEVEQLKAALTDEGHTPTNMQMWAARALRAENMVARLQTGLEKYSTPDTGGEYHNPKDWMEISRLKAELAKFTQPLTDEQASRAFDIFTGAGPDDNKLSRGGIVVWQDRDAAIRAAREGAGK